MADQVNTEMKTTSVSKNVVALIVLILVALAMVFGWTFLYGPNAHYQLTKEKSQSASPTSAKPMDTLDNFFTNPNISSITATARGRVSNISGNTVVISNNGEGMTIIPDQNTKFFMLQNTIDPKTNTQSGTLGMAPTFKTSDLKVGDTIEVIFTINPQKNSLQTDRITVFK